MINKIYVDDAVFNKILNGDLGFEPEIYYLDREKISDDYILIVNKNDKKRIFARILKSNRKDIPWRQDNEFRYLEYEEFIRLRAKYNVTLEDNPEVIELHADIDSVELNELAVVFVDEKGIYVDCRSGSPSLIYKDMVFKKTEAVVNELINSLCITNALPVHVMKYKRSLYNNDIKGKLVLIQLPAGYIVETNKMYNVKFHDMNSEVQNGIKDSFERYILWILKNLLCEEEIPNREDAFQDEPDIIGEILERKIKHMHDLAYFDYDKFDSDLFRCDVEPYLSSSEIGERIRNVPKTEHNYQQMMERCYLFEALDWALDYDYERTKNDERFKQYFS